MSGITGSILNVIFLNTVILDDLSLLHKMISKMPSRRITVDMREYPGYVSNEEFIPKKIVLKAIEDVDKDTIKSRDDGWELFSEIFEIGFRAAEAHHSTPSIHEDSIIDIAYEEFKIKDA